MNESAQGALPVDNENTFEEDPTMEEVKDNSGYDTEIPGEDAEDWGDWDSWEADPYTKKAAQRRLDEQAAATKISHDVVKQATIAASHWHVVRIIASALLFAGGAWALISAIVLLTNGSFIQQATERLLGLDILDIADVLFVVTLLSPPNLLALLGFVLIGIAVRVSRYPVVQRSLSGLGQIQHEIASGFGETRPLVQVVQETVNNARQTFIVQLRLSQAMFWAGMLFIAVAFFRVLILGETDWLTISLTGGAGLFSWIFSYFIAQRGNIQANLADVTQLELGLVGLAKQVSAIDHWVATFLTDSWTLDQELLRESERSTTWALQALQRGTFAAAGLVELYAQAAEGEKSEQKERRKLLNEAAQIHTGLVSDITVISKTEKVPDLVKDGKTTTKKIAAKQLEAKALKPKWDPADAADDWVVVSQDPPKDKEVAKGSEITVKLQKPAELVEVPDLVKDGKSTKAAAAKELEAKGLKPKWDPADAADNWIVVSQGPPKDKEVAKGSEITVRLKRTET